MAPGIRLGSPLVPTRPHAATHTACPDCGGSLHRVGPRSRPWCPDCAWNLDTYDPATSPYRGTRLLSRWGYRRGRRLDARLLSELGAGASPATGSGKGFVWLVAVSALVVLLLVACVVGAAWVWLGPTWPIGVRLVLSLLLLALALALVPRLDGPPRASRLPDGQGIELRRLVDEVAAAVGAGPPDAIVLDMSANAGVGRFGWRQQTMLVIGVPLWLMLPPQARISVLAHEFGHVVNHDPMRSVLTLPARSFGAKAVAATGGRNPWARAFEGVDSAAWHGGTAGSIGGVLVYGLLAVVNTVGATIQLLVDSVAMPDSRRAEYLADLRAREVGGTEAFVVSEQRLLLADDIWQDLWDQAPRTQPEDLPGLVERSAARREGHLAIERQASRRGVDLWSSHPCADDRIALMEQLPALAPSYQPGEQRWAAIDAELSGWYAHLHRHLLGTRDRIEQVH